jgi:hypothetical protein
VPELLAAAEPEADGLGVAEAVTLAVALASNEPLAAGSPSPPQALRTSAIRTTSALATGRP